MRIKKLFTLQLLFSLSTVCFSQKDPINNHSVDGWPHLGGSSISNDGKYVWYEYSSGKDGSILYHYTVGKGKTKKIIGGHGATFTPDNRLMIFHSHDTVAILSNQSSIIHYLPGISEYFVPQEGNWYYYKKGNTFYLKNTDENKQFIYQGIVNALLNKDGTGFVIQDSTGLRWLDVNSGKLTTIYSGLIIGTPVFDNTGSQLTFMVSSPTPTIYYFKKDTQKAMSVVSGDFYDAFALSEESPRFSRDGKQIWFSLKKRNRYIPKDSLILTDKILVWHYLDPLIQSQQLESAIPEDQSRRFLAAYNIASGRSLLVETDDTIVERDPGNKYAITRNNIDQSDCYWNESLKWNYTLVDITNGKKHHLAVGKETVPILSPTEKYVYILSYTDPLCYEIATGTIYHLNKGIPLEYLKIDTTRFDNFRIMGYSWQDDDQSLLLLDEYDIWKVSPTGKFSPLNLTKGYGRQNEITFRPVKDQYTQENIWLKGKQLLLAALDKKTKKTSFYTTSDRTFIVPKSLTSMESGVYFYPDLGFYGTPNPKKARKREFYLLQHVSEKQAPVPVITSNFKQFKVLQDVQPQKEFNWLTSEIINYSLSNGETNQAILYKPENFDPNKKYPIIFNYYDDRASEVYRFIWPELSGANLNIAWYVSNGYLVCIPNIYYKLASTGDVALDAVESAVKFLETYSWLDTTKMGLQGHSFGGYETMYIAAKSHRFAAAQSTSGLSNYITEYGTTGFGGKSLASMCETGQLHMGIGNIPSDSPQSYIYNSPVFWIGKMTTPLLLVHGRKDGAVPFAHSLEMFTSMRRLQKTVWLIEYENEGHIIMNDRNNTLDYNIRQQQFFDHYLKGKPAPEWMVTGVPAKYKGIKSGLNIPNSPAN